MANRFYLFLTLFVLLASCQLSGPVSSDIEIGSSKIVAAPKQFKSPITELRIISSKVSDLSKSINFKKVKNNNALRKYLEWVQAWETYNGLQLDAEKELNNSGKLILEPGRSYSFELDSYCVHAGSERPFKGDGLQLGLIKGPAEKWLPQLLRKQSILKLPHEEVQYLIWALLSDMRFDELAFKKQKMLLKIFPDAAVRFGNRRLENYSKGLLDQVLPEYLKDLISKGERYRELLKSYRDDYKSLENIFAPPSKRKRSIEVGWLQMDGYLMKVTSESYSKVHIDIYVPMESREPNNTKYLTVENLIALPAVGQRLAISSKSNREPQQINSKACQAAKEWTPRNCKPMTVETRKKIIELANPKNFPNLKYKSPPTKSDETDCSHFVNGIYDKAGIEYPYFPTGGLECLKTLNEVDNSEGKMGDIILFDHHVGVLTEDGQVISATLGGKGQKQSVQKYPKEIFGKGKIYQWKCP